MFSAINCFIPSCYGNNTNDDSDDDESNKTNSMPIDINSECYVEGRKGMMNKRIVHRIIFVRHGESESNVKLMNNESIKNKSRDTDLTSNGIQQAQDVRIYFKKLNYIPNEIIYSPLSRAYDTAFPTILENEYVTITKKINLSEYNKKCEEIITAKDNGEQWTYKKDTVDSFEERVQNEFNLIKNKGSVEKRMQTVVFTHSQVIATILNKCINGNINDNSDNILKNNFHLSNGSITCIDIDEDGYCNVQAVNYTKHLSIKTGHHSPFI
jgi:broad specificity phosphatase PhoE